MNKKGMSLVELLAVVVIIGAICMIAVPAVTKYIDKGSVQTFLTYESSAKDAATNFVLDCVGSLSGSCDLPEKGEVKLFYLNDLIKKGYIDEIKNPSGEACHNDSSFVIVTNRGNLNYKFNTCLVCDDYITDDDLCASYIFPE